MAEEGQVQGLSAEISGDATPLLRALEKAEAAMRAFATRWDGYQVRLGVNFAGPGAGAPGGPATAGGPGGGPEILPAMRAPAGAMLAGVPVGGRFLNPEQARSLTPQLDRTLATNDALLAAKVGNAARASAAVAIPSQASAAPAPTTVGPPTAGAARTHEAPLVLNTRTGTFTEDFAPPSVAQIPPQQLVPFRELNRATSPREARHLAALTKQIDVQGIREPLELEHDLLTDTVALRDGNHRLAAALRLGLPTVPVVGYQRRGSTRELSPLTPEELLAKTPFGPADITRQPTPEAQASAPSEDAARATAQERANARGAGATVQYRTAAGGIGRVRAQVAGVAGAEEMAVGGFDLRAAAAEGSLARGLHGAEEAGAAPSTSEVIRSLQARVRELESGPQQAGGLSAAQIAQRQAAGRASYQQAVAEGRAGPGIQGFRARTPVAVAIPQIETPQAAAPQAAAEIPRNPAETGTPIFDSNRWAASIQANSSRRAEMMAYSALFGTPLATLENWAPGFLDKSIAAIKQQSPQQFSEKYNEALEQLQTGGRGTPTGAGRQIVLPEVRTQITAASPTLTAALGAIAESQQAGFIAQQVRPSSPRVATARALGGLLGVSDVQELERQRSQQETRLRQFTEVATAATAKRQAYETALQEREEKGLPITEKHIAALDKIKQAETDATKAVEEQTVVLGAATKAVQGAGGPLRGFAASFAGGVAGGLAFGAAMQFVGSAIGLVDKAIGPVVERWTGYQNVAAKLTDTLSDQTRQAKGQVDVVLAQAAAQADLNSVTAAAIQPALASRTATEAGNKALSDQVDLVQSALAIQRQQGQFTAQNPATAGLNQNLFQTTGGLNILGIQTPLFGVPSTQELIGRTLEQALPGAALQTPTAALPAGPLGPRWVPGRGDVAGTPLSSQNVNDLNSNIDYLNEAMKKGGETTVRFAAETDKVTKTETDLANAQADLLQAIAPNIANALRTQGGRVTIQGLTGSGLQQQQQFAQALNAFNFGAQRPDVQTLLAQQAPAIAAQRALFRQQAEDQRRLFLPAQFGLQTLAQPITRFGTGFTGQAPAEIGGAQLPVPAALQGAFGQGGGAYAQAFGRFAPVLTGVDQQLQRLQADGRAALEALVPGDQINQFRALEGQIQSTGQAIAGIQAGITQEQTNYQIAQYNEQLRIATRSRTDLLQLTRQEGAVAGDNLGLLERQSIELGRQSDLLGLQLTQLQLEQRQRQVNLQVALAGFTAPGITPEERAARIEEAQREASYAQKQLDIQKQQLGIQRQTTTLGFRVQDIGFSRQLTDINKQIALINQGIKVTADVSAADQAIAHLNALQNELVKKAQTYVDESTKAIAAAESATAQIAAETGNIFGDVLRQTARAWGIFGQQASAAYAGIITGGTNLGTNQFTGTRGAGAGLQRAGGFLGTVKGATQMVVGEAGPETVAVIRNPREMMMGGGGGSGTGSLTINFNGPITVGSKEDLDALTTLLTNKVVEKMSRTSSMLGFRGPN